MAYCSVEGVRLFYEWTPGSSAGTVVFLNGVMTTTSSWELYAGLWRAAGWGVVLHDFRGQLKSDKPDEAYTFTRHVEDLRVLLDSLDIGEVHLIGTSYGGEVALHFASEHSDRVKSMSVIDSVSEVDDLLDAFVRSWLHLAHRQTASQFYWSAIPTLYSRHFIREQRGFLEERLKNFTALPDEYFAGQRRLYEAFLSIDVTDRLSEISCPTLVVCGEEDLLKPPRFSRLIADRIPASELVILPRCGHVAIFEQPEALKSLLFGFTMKNHAVQA